MNGQIMKDCGQYGPTVSSTEYISECETTQHEHEEQIDRWIDRQMVGQMGIQMDRQMDSKIDIEMDR